MKRVDIAQSNASTAILGDIGGGGGEEVAGEGGRREKYNIHFTSSMYKDCVLSLPYVTLSVLQYAHPHVKVKQRT